MKMNSASEALAQSITSSSSKQANFIASLLVDKPLISDFYRAYAYFRWADDVIDDQCQSVEERRSFIKGQKNLIDSLYLGEKPNFLPEEEMVVDLIRNGRGESNLLQSYIYNLLSILEFDAGRGGKLVSEQELIQYSNYIGKGVTDLLLYCIGNDYSYPSSEKRYFAATGAHIVHLLRDYVEDLPCGYINIPKEYLDAHGLNPKNIENLAFRNWVKKRVKLARKYFREGKKYIDKVDVLRYKIMAYCYCLRFETILDTIEKDNYVLRAEYNNRRSLLTWVKMAYVALKVTAKHFSGGKNA
ncbi:squalene/phytoene synthase family protein [Candidatus Micrarchaeota archaeon]|nr:squalene/phytoene synthase family protein [Candidatus Micrarchaeota archaeon]MBU1166525.1 squalene/phytoene synthase family protein [Candidatus Micrarchaeota archaeon]MBU1887537.1 squalene/phytoene synthase family protein [Candidatus Micrarchaeota archaeon]